MKTPSEAGKGDDRRPEAEKGAFEKGYDAIDWGKREEKEPEEEPEGERNWAVERITDYADRSFMGIPPDLVERLKNVLGIKPLPLGEQMPPIVRMKR